MITSGTNKNEVANINRQYTNLLYFKYLQIYNIVKNIEYSKKQGKGLKIITPKQMLSCLPVLLAQIHAGNSSANLKTK